MAIFKRIRSFKGSTILFRIPLNKLKLESFQRVVRAEVRKFDGAPITRFHTSYDAINISCAILPDQSIRLSGHYKYDIVVQDRNGLHTVQHGILEVL